MINNFKKFNDVIDLIEENLQNDTDIMKLARYVNLSVYEFRRIFSFIAGVPIGEYIKKRKLSSAAEDLLENKNTIANVASKYGYSSPSSFSRAFKEFHGYSPNEIMRKNISMFTKLSLSFGISGGENISYSIINDEDFCVNGVCEVSDITDSECCENVWESFNNSDMLMLFTDDEKIYTVYESIKNGVKCTIGKRNGEIGTSVQKSMWAVFKMNTTEDGYVNNFYNNILYKWLNSSKFKRREAFPNLEVFPYDMSVEGFEWEIRVPIEEKSVKGGC